MRGKKSKLREGGGRGICGRSFFAATGTGGTLKNFCGFGSLT